MLCVYKKFILSVLVITIVFSSIITGNQAIAAGKAQMLLSPTRLVFDNKKRYQTLSLKNHGTATGRYRIDIVDSNMGEDGAIKMLEDDEDQQYSAKKMLRVSPRSVTIKAGTNQNIRLLVKKPADLADGEYRSHLRVKMLESNIDKSAGNPVDPDKSNISVKAKLVMVIPVIVRAGEVEYEVDITAANLSNNKKAVIVDLSRAGDRSSMGNITITHISKNGNKTILNHLSGAAIYREVNKRKLNVPLKEAGLVNMNSGKLVIQYSEQGDVEGKLTKNKEILL